MSDDKQGWARFLPLADYERLKAAWRDLVKACGGLDRVARITRAKNKSHTSEYGRPQCLDRFPPIDVIADLEADCGEPIVTRDLADMLGCDVVARETKPSTETLQALTARMAKEFGEAADKCIRNEQNCDDTLRELGELRDVIDTIMATLTTRHTLRAVS